MLLSLLSGMICLFLRVSSPKAFPPPLSAEEEKDCFLRIKQGDTAARGKLIEHNLRLVAHIVKKYYAGAPGQEDLVSIGTVGLIKAIDSFDITKGAKFATYGARCVQNEILMHFRANRRTECEVSINETIDTDKDGNPLTYMEIISCEDTIAEDLDTRMHSSRAIEIMNRVLTPRERQIIILRYGLGYRRPVTQRELAAGLGISRSYVSRIEKGAIEKIRAEFQRLEQAGIGD